MEIAKYSQLKQAGGIVLSRLGPETYQVVSKRFDQSTGRELKPEVSPCDREAIVNMIAEIEKQVALKQTELDNAKALLADIDVMEAGA